MPEDRDLDPSVHHEGRAMLSALVDGEATPDATAQACRDWRGDASIRQDWHVYHLVGDVMRSDELAGSASGDAQFLSRLREQMRSEPIPLTAQQQEPQSVARKWFRPAAVAAGVAVVSLSTLSWLNSAQGPTGWSTPMAVTAPGGAEALRQVGSAAAPASARVRVLGGQFVGDAGLGPYFEAHRGAVGAGTAVPGGALRNVELLVPQQ